MAIDTSFDRARRWSMCIATCSVLACGDAGPTSDLAEGSSGPDGIAEGEAGERLPEHASDRRPDALIELDLEVESGRVIAKARNTTSSAAELVLNGDVRGADGLYVTDALGSLHLEPGEAADLDVSDALLGRQSLSNWARVTLNFDARFEDERQDGYPVSVFVEQGQPAPEQGRVGSGRLMTEPMDLEDPPPAGGIDVEAEPGDAPTSAIVLPPDTSRVCFGHFVQFSGGTKPGVDYLSGTSANIQAKYQYIKATSPSGLAYGRYTDALACIYLPSEAGTWSFEAQAIYWDQKVLAYVVDFLGSINRYTVTAQLDGEYFNPAVSIAPSETVAKDAQDTLALIQYALYRIGSYAPNGAFLRVEIQDDSGSARYVPETSTIELADYLAQSRSSIVHEFGHWLHFKRVPNLQKANYDYTNSEAVGQDSCVRNGDHGWSSVEFKSGAHNEAMAHFLEAMVFNNTNQTSCALPTPSVVDCSGGGPFIEQCWEWGDADSFGDTGNEHDWLRMYWDYLTRESGDLNAYFNAENQVTGWSHTNRFSKIRNALPAAERTKFLNAADGNIYE